MIDRQICFIIPAFNEQKTILNVIQGIEKFGHVIVIDDCSNDKTHEILSKLEISKIRNETNLGYGLSLNIGLKKAYELNMKFAITLDADGQHDVNDVIKIKNLLFSGNTIAYGKRKFLPRFSEKIFSFYTSYVYNISDPLCGLKGYNLEDCRDLGILDKNNQIGAKTLLNCRRKKLKIQQFEINHIIRADKSRFGGSLNANFKILKTLISLVLNDLLRLFKINK